jgi:hypothetical protein
MPSGLSLPRKYVDRSRASERVTLPSGRLVPRGPDMIRTVRPTEPPPSRRQERPSERFTLKNKKTEEKIAEFNFSQVSFRTRMYNPLITQSKSISKTK